LVVPPFNLKEIGCGPHLFFFVSEPGASVPLLPKPFQSFIFVSVPTHRSFSVNFPLFPFSFFFPPPPPPCLFFRRRPPLLFLFVTPKSFLGFGDVHFFVLLFSQVTCSFSDQPCHPPRARNVTTPTCGVRNLVTPPHIRRGSCYEKGVAKGTSIVACFPPLPVPLLRRLQVCSFILLTLLELIFVLVSSWVPPDVSYVSKSGLFLRPFTLFF